MLDLDCAGGATGTVVGVEPLCVSYHCLILRTSFMKFLKPSEHQRKSLDGYATYLIRTGKVSKRKKKAKKKSKTRSCVVVEFRSELESGFQRCMGRD